jgi:hypothetical protein
MRNGTRRFPRGHRGGSRCRRPRAPAVAPDQRRLARANRAFAIRAVRVLADAGIRQFIDLGTGFPASPSVHEVAREADPSASVVYVDYDPIVDAEDPAGIIAQFRDRMQLGSYLVLSQFSSESDQQAMAALRAVAAGTPVETYFRAEDQILRFFDRFELVEPGLTSVQEWRPDTIPAPTRLKIAGAVGLKPLGDGQPEGTPRSDH